MGNKSKTVVCKIDPVGCLHSKIYILGGGYVLNQVDTTTATVANAISTICETNEIETVALYGPETYLSKIQKDILEHNTNFAYRHTQVLINPVEGVM